MTDRMQPSEAIHKGKGIVRALRTVSIHTGRRFTMSSKADRFTIQKTVYLLRRLGYPAAQQFDFNIYLNGPYSPDLAEVYYAYEDDGLRAAPPADNLKPAMIATVRDALRGSPEFLEGLTTVVDGIAQGRPAPDALAWAKSIKPHLNGGTWQEVQRFLGTHRDLT